MMMETKLLDALFEATLAPYNRSFNSARPFETAPASDAPRALQKFIWVAIQKVLQENQRCLEYFTAKKSRSWWPVDVEAHTPQPFPPILPAVRRAALWRDLISVQGEDPLGPCYRLTQKPIYQWPVRGF